MSNFFSSRGFKFVALFFLFSIPVFSQSYYIVEEPQKAFVFFGGLSIPTGEFAAKSGQNAGAAELGFAVGGEFLFPVENSLEFSITGNLNFNQFDESALQFSNASTTAGPWVSIWAMGGFGFNAELSERAHLYGKGLLGLLVGISPDLKISNQNGSVTQDPAVAGAIAYGIEGGLRFNNRFDLGLRLMSGEPEYEVTASGGGSTSTGKVKQPTTVVQLTFGIILDM